HHADAAGRYELRRTSKGSSRVARRPGMYAATTATSTRNAATAPKAVGSVVLTPKTSDAITRVRTKLRTMPMAMPASDKRMPSPTTKPSTSACCAPSAMRHQIRHDAVHAKGGQHEGRAGERRDDEEGEAPVGHRRCDHAVNRPHLNGDIRP